jgi:hypothetical protein
MRHLLGAATRASIVSRIASFFPRKLATFCFILHPFSCQDQSGESLHPLHNQRRSIPGRPCPPSPIPTLGPTLADLAQLRLHLITRQRADLSDVTDSHQVPGPSVGCCAGHSSSFSKSPLCPFATCTRAGVPSTYCRNMSNA